MKEQEEDRKRGRKRAVEGGGRGQEKEEEEDKKRGKPRAGRGKPHLSFKTELLTRGKGRATRQDNLTL